MKLLGHYLNKPVLVSIPEIFDGEDARQCVLSGIEPAGIWLVSDELGSTLFPETANHESMRVFVPFTQIRYLAEPPPPAPRPAPHAPHKPAKRSAADKK